MTMTTPMVMMIMVNDCGDADDHDGDEAAAADDVDGDDDNDDDDDEDAVDDDGGDDDDDNDIHHDDNDDDDDENVNDDNIHDNFSLAVLTILAVCLLLIRLGGLLEVAPRMRREVLRSGAIRPAAGVGRLEKRAGRERAREGQSRGRGEPRAVNRLKNLRRHLGVLAGGALGGSVT